MDKLCGKEGEERGLRGGRIIMIGFAKSGKQSWDGGKIWEGDGKGKGNRCMVDFTKKDTDCVKDTEPRGWFDKKLPEDEGEKRYNQKGKDGDEYDKRDQRNSKDYDEYKAPPKPRKPKKKAEKKPAAKPGAKPAAKPAAKPGARKQDKAEDDAKREFMKDGKETYYRGSADGDCKEGYKKRTFGKGGM